MSLVFWPRKLVYWTVLKSILATVFHRTKRILFRKLGLHSSPGCKSVTHGSSFYFQVRLGSQKPGEVGGPINNTSIGFGYWFVEDLEWNCVSEPCNKSTFKWLKFLPTKLRISEPQHPQPQAVLCIVVPSMQVLKDWKPIGGFSDYAHQ